MKNSLPVAMPLMDIVTPPEGMHLARALLTTYEPPDAGVLLDKYLPLWLGMQRRPSEVTDVAFLAERARFLREAKKTIAIFHSHGTLAGHPWLWSQYVRPFPIGPGPDCRQHSKLWMLHWQPETMSRKRQELLQLVISSLNLTHAALSGQVQAVWQATIPLDAAAKKDGRQRWGQLTNFLEALSENVTQQALKKEASGFVEHFLTLLDLAFPPSNVKFIASIPMRGTISPHTQLKTAFKGATVESVDVLAPDIGQWSPQALSMWCQASLADRKGRLTESKKLRILRQEPPQNSRWYLNKKVCPPGLSVELKRVTEGVFDDQKSKDQRWLHAKVYEFRSRIGGKRCCHTLVTSANFTEAAWGNPKGDPPTNFELGVLVEGRGFAFDPKELKEMELFPEKDELNIAGGSAVLATWDGDRIEVNFQSAISIKDCRVITDKPDKADRPAKWKTEKQSDGRLTMVWSLQYASSAGRPTILALGNNQADSAIIWVGEALNDDIEAPTDPEIPIDRRAELEAAIIAERYGGMWVEGPDGPDDSPKKPCEQGKNISAGGYGIPVIEKGRELGAVIDGWNSTLRKMAKWGEVRVLNDGKRLADLWKVLGSAQGLSHDLAGVNVAYLVAAQELATRIQVAMEGAK